jgi:hypothetical protein
MVVIGKGVVVWMLHGMVDGPVVVAKMEEGDGVRWWDEGG